MEFLPSRPSSYLAHKKVRRGDSYFCLDPVIITKTELLSLREEAENLWKQKLMDELKHQQSGSI